MKKKGVIIMKVRDGTIRTKKFYGLMLILENNESYTKSD